MHVYEICMYLLSTCGVAFRIPVLKADADLCLMPVIAILTAKCYFGLKAQCFTYTSERKLSRMLYHVKSITVLFFRFETKHKFVRIPACECQMGKVVLEIITENAAQSQPRCS